MFRKPGIVFFILLLIVLQSSIAQTNFSNIWYFGQNAGVSFNNNNAVAVTNSNMNTPEGCAVRTGSMGNLMFYSNGNMIWDRNHNIMPNGLGLNGNPSATQSVIIVPKPEDLETNYVFTLDKEGGPKGLQYSIVFMSSVTGNGVVTDKNISLIAPVAEKLISVKHCNLVDQWVIVHAWNSNSFYSFLVDSTGVDSIPVQSNTGMMYLGNTINTIGYMKASPYGDKIAVAHSALGIIEIFSFDNISGILSSPITLHNIDQVYGLEFSPSGDVLFCSTITGKIYQFNLTLGNQNDIENSKTLIGTSSSLIGALQRGPDGYVYVARDLSYYLGILLNTNSWSYVSYIDDGIYLNGKKSEAGLPQIIPKSGECGFEASPKCFGDNTYHYYGDSTAMDFINWNFNDSITGQHNFSNLFYPSHVYSEAGTYDVIIIYGMCGTIDTVHQVVCIDTIPVFTLLNDTSICENTPLKLMPNFQVEICREPKFEWSTGDTSPYINVNSTGIYSLTVTNSCGTWSDSMEIRNIFPVPELDLGNDTSICAGDSIILNAGENHILCVWNTGDSINSIATDTAGNYWAQVMNEYGCFNTDYINLYIEVPPDIKIGNDTSICLGSEFILSPKFNSGNLLWQDGSSNSDYIVSETGKYWVQAVNKCGVDSDTIMVELVPCLTKIYAPNSFTPNGDGLNDEFLLKGIHVKDFNLHIYNRWGELVFHTKDMNDGWDGTFQNKRCKNDVYSWVVNYADFFHEYHIISGQVILVR